MNAYRWQPRQGLTLERLDLTAPLPATLRFPYQSESSLGVQFCLHSECMTDKTIKGKTYSVIIYALPDEWLRDLADIKRAVSMHADTRRQITAWLSMLN